MKFFKKYFPHAFRSKDFLTFIITMLIYVLIDAVCGFAVSLVDGIPVLGFIFVILGAAIGMYALVGIVLSILVFLKVIK